MTRRRAPRATVGISLFPFLAVLICTVGVLIVLLVLMVHMARVDASDEAAQPDPLATPAVGQVAQEDAAWQASLLRQQRDRVRQEVARRRLELSHLEEHIRELEGRWQALRASAADLERRLHGGAAEQATDQAQLEQVREAVRRAAQELADAQARAAGQPRCYAIVPYDGPQGTHRRPIYIECAAESVIIQPEGVALTARDFAGPLGPGNPLDAALRAIREYLAHLGTLPADDEPYPLLIVRPGGVESYAAARSAMRTWDDEFGYELVDADMRLAYPAADPALAQLLTKVVQDARSRQEILAAAMPSHFAGGRDAEIGFVATPTTGGFQPRGGASGRRESRVGGFGRGEDARFADGVTDPAAKPGQPDAADAPPGPHAPDTRPGPSGAAPTIQFGHGGSPLTRARGHDWGLPPNAAQATGVVRPIRLGCYADRLILFPERDERRAPDTILVEGSMLDEIDALAARIATRVESWGLAVAGGYWKPVLHVQVAPNAEARFRELQLLLDGSGWELRRADR